MKTIYIRCTGNKWSRPTVNRSEIDVEIDFGKFVIGKANADIHTLIEKQLEDLREYDIIKNEHRSLKKNIEGLENYVKKLSKNIDELTDQVDDLECEKSDLQDEVYELEETIENCDDKITYLENRTYE